MILYVQRKPDGNFAVSFDRGSSRILRQLPRKLREVLENAEASEKLLGRLFPRAYKDPDDEAEYRQLMQEDLLGRKLESIKVFERALRRRKLVEIDIQSEGPEECVEITIRPKELSAWLGFVNDFRLVLGTMLDLQEDYSGWPSDVDEKHPQFQEHLLFEFLSSLMDALLKVNAAPEK